MITLKYHLVDPYWRERVDLRDYEKKIAKVVECFPISLDKVTSGYFQITILTDAKKNSIVRKFGNQLAKTSLGKYSRVKKGKRQTYELFRQKKK